MKLVPNETAKDWFDEAGNITREKLEEITNRHAQEVMRKYDEALEAKVSQRLKDSGITFDNRDAFLTFCKKHVDRVTYEDRPYYCEFWLNHDNGEKQYLFFAKTELKTEYLNGEIITTIG